MFFGVRGAFAEALTLTAAQEEGPFYPDRLPLDTDNDLLLINDAFFVTDPAASSWQDIPASYHNGACGFSFADGHAEIKKWLSRTSKYPVDFSYGPQLTFDAAGRRDIEWAKERIQLIPYR
ncbi:partial protocatechuate 3,4-dioxygenase, beta subunit, partial [Anaerolineae bacterium]